MKHQWLVHEAQKWVGVHESSENRGPVVDQFITETGGQLGQPWCVSFVRFCIQRVDKDFKKIYALSVESRTESLLYKTHSVMRLWDNTPEEHRWLSPLPGWISMWQHYNSKGIATGLGHCGIVTKSLEEGRWFSTVEGNTAQDGVGIEREGDEVFQKVRSSQGGPRFRLMGFVDPWPKITKT